MTQVRKKKYFPKSGKRNIVGVFLHNARAGAQASRREDEKRSQRLSVERKTQERRQKREAVQKEIQEKAERRKALSEQKKQDKFDERFSKYASRFQNDLEENGIIAIESYYIPNYIPRALEAGIRAPSIYKTLVEGKEEEFIKNSIESFVSISLDASLSEVKRKLLTSKPNDIEFEDETISPYSNPSITKNLFSKCVDNFIDSNSISIEDNSDLVDIIQNLIKNRPKNLQAIEFDDFYMFKKKYEKKLETALREALIKDYCLNFLLLQHPLEDNKHGFLDFEIMCPSIYSFSQSDVAHLTKLIDEFPKEIKSIKEFKDTYEGIVNKQDSDNDNLIKNLNLTGRRENEKL